MNARYHSLPVQVFHFWFLTVCISTASDKWWGERVKGQGYQAKAEPHWAGSSKAAVQSIADGMHVYIYMDEFNFDF